jgi:hypothetical protein
MKVEFEKNDKNPDLDKEVENSTELKEILVSYVGSKVSPPDGESVTIADITEVLADEFPEFLMVVAEENFMRGYSQALEDREGVILNPLSDKNEKNNKK